ncbi:tRNA 2-selenouridine synthase [Rubidibacter lacunae KORDI 51-2]|uniref:tRNA 2-selenouridine synthase n=1 Tax=Rubidibacter lacunae KORDI 51-2 TaxID=582515 RepID=U5DM55_9CHRO|nr:tRNA 2-selenouridine(34) synthase MnmH [Rubidibacter lacunae]ERN42761.1 tRNA 2-selenouridine synthase [Rubidibacter lacunae KORDI 51-2]
MIARSPEYVTFPLPKTYSEIIDVRSPSEFQEDRIPGAVNLPVLDDDERAWVGTLYRKDSPFAARKVGAALVSRNIARHLETHLSDRDKDYKPLIYCWRGGQRSNSLAMVLLQIGWQATVVRGGYKTYRNHVRDRVAELSGRLQFQILCGLTGSGKTRILQRLAAVGAQAIDLEGLANHRGSLLGQEWSAPSSTSEPEVQPSQKWFESEVWQALERCEPGRPVWLESESNRIGQLHVPAPLWQQMKNAQCVEVQVPVASRVRFLLDEYPHLVEHPEFLKARLRQLRERHGTRKVQEWCEAIDRGQFSELVCDLLESHYDPTYQRSMAHAYYPRVTWQLSVPDLTAAEIDCAATRLQSGERDVLAPELAVSS